MTDEEKKLQEEKERKEREEKEKNEKEKKEHEEYLAWKRKQVTYDFGAELAELEKKFKKELDDIAKKAGINKWLVYIPVGVLFTFAIVFPTLSYLAQKVKERKVPNE